MADKKGALAGIPTYMFDDEESKARQKAYNEALERVQKSLDQRKNRFIDPTWAAAAEAFLTPKSTGSSFEGFGTLAKKLREAQATEEEEERMIAAQELEAAKLGVDLTARQKMMEQTGRLFSGQQPFVSPGAASGAAPGAPQGGPLTAEENAIVVQLRAKGADAPTILKALQDYRSGKIKVTEGGVYDIASGAFTPFEKGGASVERDIYVQEPDGSMSVEKYNVPPSIASRLDSALSKGDMEEYRKLADMVTRGPLASKPAAPAAPAPAAAPVAPAPAGAPDAAPAPVGAPAGAPPADTRGRLPSASEREALSAARKASAEATSKAEAERQVKEKTELIDKSRAAQELMGTYSVLEKLISSPDASSMFGLLERAGIVPNLIALAESGVGVKDFSIGIPEIRGVYQRAGLVEQIMKEKSLPRKLAEREAEKIIAETQLGTSLMARIQLQMSRLQQGQGAVSDFERRLFADAAISPRDNPATIRQKLKLLMLRAEFDKNVGLAARKFKGSMDDFITDEGSEYNRLVKDYENKLASAMGISTNLEKYQNPWAPKTAGSAPAAGQPSPAGRPSAPAAAPKRNAPLQVDPSALSVQTEMS